MRILLENKMKKSNVLWLFIGVVLSLPILLNIFLMVEWLPVIQAGTTPALWISHSSANGGGCFANCSKLDNYSEIPDQWK